MQEISVLKRNGI